MLIADGIKLIAVQSRLYIGYIMLHAAPLPHKDASMDAGECAHAALHCTNVGAVLPLDT